MTVSVQAAFASLFSILAATAFGSLGPKGFALDVATAPRECGDGQYVVVSVEPGGTVDLYGYGHHVKVSELQTRLQEIFRRKCCKREMRERCPQAIY